MKLVFLIDKMHDYSAYSGIINEAIKNKFRVVCFHNEDPLVSNKNFRKPSVSKSPYKNQVKIEKVFFKKNLYQKLSETNCDYIFTKKISTGRLNKKFVQKLKKKICILMDSLDVADALKNLHYLNDYGVNIFIWSLYHKTRIIKILKENYKLSYLSLKKNYHKFIIVGHNYFDFKINKELMKKKYNVPKDKKIILYCPYSYDDNNVPVNKKYWKVFFAGLDIDFFPEEKIIKKKILNSILKTFFLIRSFIFSYSKIFKFFKIKNEYQILKEIKNFCDKNNHYLIVKTRKKYPLNSACIKFSDQVIEDDQIQQNPGKLQEIISFIDLNICYGSHVAFEVALKNVSSIVIQTPKVDWPSFFYKYWGPKNRFYNYKDVIRSVEPQKLKLNFKRVTKRKFNEYKKIYLGDDNISKNIFKILKKNQ